MHALNRTPVLVVAVVLFCAAFPALGQCSWATAIGAMNFTYDPYSATPSNTATATGQIRCTGANYNVRISSTAGSGGVWSPWRTLNGGLANYNLYTDAARTVIWGDGNGNGSSYDSGTINANTTATLTEYGLVPISQEYPVGTTTDIVFVTLGYQRTSGGAWTYLAPISMTVNVTVASKCKVDTFTLPFGNYNPLSATDLTQTSTVRIYCTAGTPATFALNNGANYSGTTRRMVNAGNYLNYAASLALASATPTRTQAPINNGITLTGTIAALQDVPASATQYIDTLQVSVNY